MNVGETIPGKKYRFAYPAEFTSLSDYTAHANQIVTVLRECSDKEADKLYDDPEGNGTTQCVDTMWLIQASDGWQGMAWDSELEEV